MNKRAEEIFPPSKILAYILFGIFSAVSIIFLLLIYNSMTSSTYTVPEGLEDFLVLEYVTKSPSCFTYQDQYTGNIHWLSFDAGKLDSKHFTSCFQIGLRRFFGFGICYKIAIMLHISRSVYRQHPLAEL